MAQSKKPVPPVKNVVTVKPKRGETMDQAVMRTFKERGDIDKNAQMVDLRRRR